MLYTVQSGSYDLYRDSVHLHENCLVSTYQLEFFYKQTQSNVKLH